MFFYVYYLQNIKIALLLYRNRERTIAKTKKDKNAKIAQLVEHDLAKVGVEGSSPFFRSKVCPDGGMVDTQDLKSCDFTVVRVQVPLRIQ